MAASVVLLVVANEVPEADSEVVEGLLDVGETELDVVAAGVAVVRAPVVDTMGVEDAGEDVLSGVEVRTGSDDGEPTDTTALDVADAEGPPMTLFADDALEPHAAPRTGTTQVNAARVAKRWRVMCHPVARRAS